MNGCAFGMYSFRYRSITGWKAAQWRATTASKRTGTGSSPAQATTRNKRRRRLSNDWERWGAVPSAGWGLSAGACRAFGEEDTSGRAGFGRAATGFAFGADGWAATAFAFAAEGWAAGVAAGGVEDWTALVTAGGVGEGDGEGTAFAASTFVPDVRAAGGMGNADGVCAPAGIVAAACKAAARMKDRERPIFEAMRAVESNIRRPMSDSPGHLGLKSGISLVVSNMVGAGVFISAGFMAQDLSPGLILISWVIGAVIALSGARAYATVARWVPHSGGEYRYVSDLMHPALGCLAGWGSLLVGFSAPIAVNALAAGEFARTLGSPIPPRLFGVFVILGLGILHATGHHVSKRGHNLLFIANALLLAGFVATGLFFGTNAWPTWTPAAATASSAFPTEAFARGLFFIAFAFSGWNAAIYNASDFRNPQRDVPRALVIGCGIVAVLYLAVNWVFVANLTPDDFKVVFGYDESKVTLGHVILSRVLGEKGGLAMSALVMLAFLAAASAMTIVGPRVYATMAQDGYLPKSLRVEPGDVPVRAIVLQCAVALAILLTHTLQQALANVGAVLTLFAALVSLSIFRHAFRTDGRFERPGALTLFAAGIHVASSVFMLYFGFRDSTGLLLWVAAVAAAGLGFWALARPKALVR